MRVTTDMIVGAGLIIALWVAIYCDDTELQKTLGSGLIGYIGRTAIESHGGSDAK